MQPPKPVSAVRLASPSVGSAEARLGEPFQLLSFCVPAPLGPSRADSRGRAPQGVLSVTPGGLLTC